MPRFFYQYFVHFLSFPEHLWTLIDDRPNVSVRLEIEGSVANRGGGKKAGKHKEELVSQKITQEEWEEAAPSGNWTQASKGTCGSWGWHPSHQTNNQTKLAAIFWLFIRLLIYCTFSEIEKRLCNVVDLAI